MKKLFIKPQLDVILVNQENILAASEGPGEGQPCFTETCATESFSKDDDIEL